MLRRIIINRHINYTFFISDDIIGAVSPGLCGNIVTLIFGEFIMGVQGLGQLTTAEVISEVESGKAKFVVYRTIFSFIFFTTKQNTDTFYIRTGINNEAASKARTSSIIKSALLGWWSFGGLVETPMILLMDLGGGMDVTKDMLATLKKSYVPPAQTAPPVHVSPPTPKPAHAPPVAPVIPAAPPAKKPAPVKKAPVKKTPPAPAPGTAPVAKPATESSPGHVFCDQCGAENRAGAKFCAKCGNKL